MTVIDFSAGPPSAASIKAAGHSGAVLYVSDPRESFMTGKAPSRAYLDDLEAHGIKYAWVSQYRAGGSMAVGDAGRGHEGGKADAEFARRRLNVLGCPDHPVFFAVDWDISLWEWNHHVADYFRGAASVLGKNRVGIYGHSRVVHWAGPENKLVAEVAPGRYLGWITRSWGSTHPNGSPRGSDYAVLFQGQHNVPGPEGVKIDRNQVFHESWGWEPIKTVRNPGYQLTGDQFPCDVAIYTSANSGWRDPHTTQYSVFHTTENGDSTPVENVAVWQQNTANQSSYNILIGVDGKTVRSNDDNRIPWSAGSPGNQKGNHASFLGQAARNRDHWFRFPKQLEAAAEWAADEHLRYGRPLVWLSPQDIRAKKRGFTSHANVYHGDGGPAYRSDPGAGFPHDWVLNRASELITQEGFLMALTDDEQRELLQKTRENWDQLRGIDGKGWAVLGQNAAGQNLTPVDAIGALRRDVSALFNRLKGGN